MKMGAILQAVEMRVLNIVPMNRFAFQKVFLGISMKAELEPVGPLEVCFKTSDEI